MFGINGGELVVLLVLIAVVIGPERLPGYAQQVGRWARGVRAVVQDARDRVSAEVGVEALDWGAFDPRQYDPRRIVRDALQEDLPLAKVPELTESPGGAGGRPSTGDSS